MQKFQQKPIFKNLLNLIQQDFPLVAYPFKNLAQQLNISENEVLQMLNYGKEQKIIRQISAIFDTKSLGYQSTLIAFQIAENNLENAAQIINSHPGVSHNYQRNHKFNLWFTLAMPPKTNLQKTIKILVEKTSAVNYLILPTLKLFKIGVKLDASGNEEIISKEEVKNKQQQVYNLSKEEILAVKILQKDLPLVPRPFKKLLLQNGVFTEKKLLKVAQDFLQKGIMRRFAAVLNHRQIGFSANGMGVWIVPENLIEKIGSIMASYKAVSHCYLRPVYPPHWLYNIFTMIHGKQKEDCEKIAQAISKETKIKDYFLLYSTKEFKKERIQYFTEGNWG